MADKYPVVEAATLEEAELRRFANLLQREWQSSLQSKHIPFGSKGGDFYTIPPISKGAKWPQRLVHLSLGRKYMGKQVSFVDHEEARRLYCKPGQQCQPWHVGEDGFYFLANRHPAGKKDGVKSSHYVLVNMTDKHPDFDYHTRNAASNEAYLEGTPCAVCGRTDLPIHEGHMHPDEPCIGDNRAPFCASCNRRYKNKILFRWSNDRAVFDLIATVRRLHNRGELCAMLVSAQASRPRRARGRRSAGNRSGSRKSTPSATDSSQLDILASPTSETSEE